MPSATKKRVAIVGAGVSGLMCARECLKERLEVRVFERKGACGGLWRAESVDASWQSASAADHGWDRLAAEVQSSAYDCLRINVPRELMGFTDFPFDTNFDGSQDKRRFCGHQEVRRYLEAFQEHFDLTPNIRFNAAVVRIEPLNVTPQQWEVEVATKGRRTVERFDFVVIGNGHYTRPHIPSFPNMDQFGRPSMHTHVYRNSKGFEGKTVVVLGNQMSGREVAMDVGRVAKEVYLCGRTWPKETDRSKPVGAHKNVHLCETILKCSGPGELTLKDGRVVKEVDCLIYGTGFLYDYPFLKPDSLLSTENRMIYPLYKHIFHGRHPSLAFANVPGNSITFMTVEGQAKYMSRVFSGRCQLPEPEQLMKEIDDSLRAYKAADKTNTLERYHDLGTYLHGYIRELIALCGDVAYLPEWRERMHTITSKLRVQHPDDYKDRQPDDDIWKRLAHHEFAIVRGWSSSGAIV